jgi:uncharacterized protein YqjF (DUF2071 family)
MARGAPVPLLTMRWHDLLFAHWRVEPAALRPLVPRGLDVDTIDGSAWLGVIPFGNARLRPLGVPLPGEAIAFGEVNVRTYVRGPDGAPAVWFFSLDGDTRLGAPAARALYGINYRRAAVRFTTAADGVTSLSMRRGGRRPAALDVRYRPTGPLTAASALDAFLTDRLVMFGRRGATLLRAEVRHGPWRLHPAEATFATVDVTARLGLPAPVGEPYIRWAEPLDVVFARPPTIVPGIR